MTAARGRWWSAAALAIVASGGGACSFVTSFDGLTSGSDAGLPPPYDAGPIVVVSKDAGEDAGAEEGDDGGNGTGSPDGGGGAMDGGGGADDATIDLDGGVVFSPDGGDGGFCATVVPAPLFCDDFDETTLAAPWDKVTGTGGTVVQNSDLAFSLPNSMLVTSNAGAPAIDLCGYKTFPGAPTTGSFILSFEINVIQPDMSTTTSDAILAAMELYDSTGARWALQLEVSYDTSKTALDLNLSENKTFVDGGTQYIPHPVSAFTLPVGTWTRVSLVTILGGANAAAIALDTGSNFQTSVTPGTVNATPEILVGGAFAEKSSHGWTVRYDDVFFEVK